MCEHMCNMSINTHILHIHMYLWMNVPVYTCIYVYVYMLYGCIHLGMYIGIHT